MVFHIHIINTKNTKIIATKIASTRSPRQRKHIYLLPISLVYTKTKTTVTKVNRFHYLQSRNNDRVMVAQYIAILQKEYSQLQLIVLLCTWY